MKRDEAVVRSAGRDENGFQGWHQSGTVGGSPAEIPVNLLPGPTFEPWSAHHRRMLSTAGIPRQAARVADAPPASSLPPLQPGTLYVVATPLGNLEDITLRAVRTLRECSLIAAEDTRHTGRLLAHFEIRKPLLSCHGFNEARRTGEIIARLRAGETIALVSDAGTPGISDPGERVVRAVLAAGLRVEPVPGPCAAVAALSASGLPADEFHFAGFLPVKAGARRRELERLLALPGTLVTYESPHRAAKLLGELAELAPGRPVVLARELTKRFEEWLRGTPADLAGRTQGRAWKGEHVFLIGPAGREPAPEREAAAPGRPATGTAAA